MWGHVLCHVTDASHGVRNFDIEADKTYLPIISRNFEERSHGMNINFFAYVSKMSGSTIRMDTFSCNHIHIDGHELSLSVVKSNPHLKSDPEH